MKTFKVVEIVEFTKIIEANTKEQALEDYCQDKADTVTTIKIKAVREK